MRAITLVLVAVLALGGTVQAQTPSFSNKDVEFVLMQFIQDLSESFEGAGSTKRRLLTLPEVRLAWEREFRSGPTLLPGCL